MREMTEFLQLTPVPKLWAVTMVPWITHSHGIRLRVLAFRTESHSQLLSSGWPNHYEQKLTDHLSNRMVVRSSNMTVLALNSGRLEGLIESAARQNHGPLTTMGFPHTAQALKLSGCENLLLIRAIDQQIWPICLCLHPLKFR